MSKYVLLCLLSFPLMASTELEEINVKASKETKEFSFGSVTEINEADMARKPLPLLSNQLDEISGMNVVQSGGPGGQVSYFIRGTEARHVSFTLDSLRLNDPSNDSRAFDASSLTHPFVSDILIFKGPQAVLFGSDAVGGLIDMRTRKGEHAPETRVNLMGGSFGTVQATIGQDWKAGNNQGTVTVTRFHTDGVSRLNEKRHNAKERDGAEITQGTTSSSHRFADKFQTDLLLSFVRGEIEYDGFGVDTSKNHAKNDQYILQQKTHYEISKESAVSIRNGVSRHQRSYYTDTPVDWYQGNLVQNELLYRNETKGFSFVTGAINEYESLDQESGLEKNFSVNSLFVQGGHKAGDFKIQAGLRGEDHSRYGNFLVGSVGASVDLGNNLFALQYSQGYKAPTLYQLYAPDTGWGSGNPDLEPEKNNSYEARWKYLDNRYEGEVSFFQNRFHNIINWIGVNGYLNQGRLTTEGVELSGALKEKHFQVRPSFVHQKIKDNEKDVYRRPLNTLQLKLVYTPVESSEFFLNYRWVSARKDLGDTGTVKLNSYDVVNAGYRYVQEKYDLSVMVQNIFDREYEDIYGFSVMPRSFYGGIGYKF